HQVIGAGAVGLAIAARLSATMATVLIERHPTFGRETSSRNSEVIHAGIYYPPDSLKTRLCIRGRHLLYEYCKRGIPFKKTGKWIVSSKQQEHRLEEIHQKGRLLDVPLYFLGSREAKRLEPRVKCESVLVSPETGIIDSHEYMQHLETELQENGGLVAYNTHVKSIERNRDQYTLQLEQQEHELAIEAPIVVNSAGLGSEEIARMFDDALAENTRIHYCKGHYFVHKTPYLTKRLIYPIPDQNVTSLGVHLTLDLGGRIKFGPDVHYMDKIDYSFVADKLSFVKAIQNYLDVHPDELEPDYTGIRPKLQAKGEKFRDFYIKNHHGFVHLSGIESPGLTSSLAIAEYVEQIL
ncbi:FAD dependent oxidoreductase, partial [Gorgonomyces haynaldii]